MMPTNSAFLFSVGLPELPPVPKGRGPRLLYVGRIAVEKGIDLMLDAFELVRDHLGRVSVRNKDVDRERIAMLNRINANLNMIARWVNTHKSSASSVEVVAHLMDIERHIRELSQ